MSDAAVDIVLLCVKPIDIEDVLREVRRHTGTVVADAYDDRAVAGAATRLIQSVGRPVPGKVIAFLAAAGGLPDSGSAWRAAYSRSG